MGRSSVGELWQVVTLVLSRYWSKTLQISQGLGLILFLRVSGLQRSISDEQTGPCTRLAQEANHIRFGFQRLFPRVLRPWLTVLTTQNGFISPQASGKYSESSSSPNLEHRDRASAQRDPPPVSLFSMLLCFIGDSKVLWLMWKWKINLQIT